MYVLWTEVKKSEMTMTFSSGENSCNTNHFELFELWYFSNTFLMFYLLREVNIWLNLKS